MRFPLALAAIASFALTGCALRSPSTPTVNNDEALMDLSRAADDINDKWSVIGSIDKHDHPGYTAYLDDFSGNYPDILTKRSTVRWSGPIEPLVRKMAEEIKVPVKVTGTPPTTPVLIYIDAHNARVGDILRDAGYQAGARAGVRVSTTINHELVELLYEPLN